MRLVLTTCPVDKSKKLMDKILKSKLAACVLDVCLSKSKFWWKGKIDEEGISQGIIQEDQRIASIRSSVHR